MIKAILPKRADDDFGSGEFGAPRGNRKHNGIDFSCPVGAWIYSGVQGSVTKLGYCYNDDPSYRYVEITDDKDRRHRYFYVKSIVRVGQVVFAGELIGRAQDIAKRYDTPKKRMINHVHLEVLQKDGTALNPEKLT